MKQKSVIIFSLIIFTLLLGNGYGLVYFYENFEDGNLDGWSTSGTGRLEIVDDSYMGKVLKIEDTVNCNTGDRRAFCAWKKVTIPEDGNLSFWYRYAWGGGSDSVAFYIDGVEQYYHRSYPYRYVDKSIETIQGPDGWKKKIFTISKGTHTLKWCSSRCSYWGVNVKSFVDSIQVDIPEPYTMNFKVFDTARNKYVDSGDVFVLPTQNIKIRGTISNNQSISKYLNRLVLTIEFAKIKIPEGNYQFSPSLWSLKENSVKVWYKNGKSGSDIGNGGCKIIDPDNNGIFTPGETLTFECWVNASYWEDVKIYENEGIYPWISFTDLDTDLDGDGVKGEWWDDGLVKFAPVDAQVQSFEYGFPQGWETGGRREGGSDCDWRSCCSWGQYNGKKYEGKYSLRSTITTNCNWAESYIKTTVTLTTEKKLTFFWKYENGGYDPDAEEYRNFYRANLRFYIDGNQVALTGGGWNKKEFLLAPGTHTLLWKLIGWDCRLSVCKSYGYIDKVQLEPPIRDYEEINFRIYTRINPVGWCERLYIKLGGNTNCPSRLPPGCTCKKTADNSYKITCPVDLKGVACGTNRFFKVERYSYYGYWGFFFGGGNYYYGPEGFKACGLWGETPKSNIEYYLNYKGCNPKYQNCNYIINCLNKKTYECRSGVCRYRVIASKCSGGWWWSRDTEKIFSCNGNCDEYKDKIYSPQITNRFCPIGTICAYGGGCCAPPNDMVCNDECASSKENLCCDNTLINLGDVGEYNGNEWRSDGKVAKCTQASFVKESPPYIKGEIITGSPAKAIKCTAIGLNPYGKNPQVEICGDASCYDANAYQYCANPSLSDVKARTGAYCDSSRGIDCEGGGVCKVRCCAPGVTPKEDEICDASGMPIKMAGTKEWINMCIARPFSIFITPKEVNASIGSEVTFTVRVFNNIQYPYTITIHDPELYEYSEKDGAQRKEEWNTSVIEYTSEEGKDVMRGRHSLIETLQPYEEKTYTLKIKVPNAKEKVIVNVTATGSFASDIAVINVLPPFYTIVIDASMFDSYSNPVPNTPVYAYICEKDVEYCTQDAPWLYTNSTVSDSNGRFEITMNVTLRPNDVYKVGVVTERGYAETLIET